MNKQLDTLRKVAGDLDQSFNKGSVLTFRFYEREMNFAYDAVVGVDERIYIAGSVIGRFAIAVLNQDGTFANEFNGNGKLLDSFHGDERSTGYRIKLVDGKIRLLGETDVSMEAGVRRCPAIASYHLNGQLDTAFGDGGYKVINPDFEAGVEFIHHYNDLHWSTHGDKTYVAAFRPYDLSVVVTCLNIHGQVDPLFGVGGVATIKHPRTAQMALIRATDEGIYLAGSFSMGGVDRRAFCKLDLEGEMDLSFGTDGFVHDETPYSGVSALPQHSSATLLGVGRNTNGSDEEGYIRYQGALVSLDQFGNPDKNFNDGAPVFTEIDFSTVWMTGAVQEDGAIVALGSTGDPRPSAPRTAPEQPELKYVDHNKHDRAQERGLESYRFTVARFLREGAIDTSFGRDHRGWITFNINQGAEPMGIAVQSDHAIIVVGFTGDYSVFVCRFNG